MSNVVQHAPGSAQVSKIDPRILPLVLASFALGTDAFVMIGMLPVIAREMQVTEGVAGQLVTAFSLTYALGTMLFVRIAMGQMIAGGLTVNMP